MSSKERITRLSKALSYLLRHGAAKEKVPMRSDGFVLVDDILKHRKYNNFTFEDIQLVVKENDKKRFTLQEENGKWYIKANQGHSIAVEDLSLTKITDPSTVPVVIHGTYMKAWPDIKKQGLCKMKRNHIHFAIGYKSAEVISGMRTSSEILIYIDLDAAIKDGVEFFLSENKVVLSPGIDGYLPTKYFKHVIKASTGLPFDNDFPTPQIKASEVKSNSNGKSEI